jgi:hypothetical protein
VSNRKIDDLRGRPWRSKLGADTNLKEILAIPSPLVVDELHVSARVIFEKLFEVVCICKYTS